MKILIASTPATGHLNPLLAIARILIAEGHEVIGLSGSIMRDRIEGIGVPFRPFPEGADHDLRDVDAAFPERKGIPAGPLQVRFDIEHVFVDPMPAQHEGLRQVLREFPADIVITDNLLFGTFPMLLGPRSERPPIIFLGSSVLVWHRDDGAPALTGFAPAQNDAEREKYAAISKEVDAIAFEPATRHLNRRLSSVGSPSLSMALFDAVVDLPDAYLQLTVQSFEFPRRDLPPSVHFVGAPSIVPNQAPLPSWAHELDGSRKVVLVTQGTVANFNFGQLVAPTLAALANEPDVLVVVTAGGRPVDAIAGPIPANARVASYLPFEWALAKADVFVTNGGYGSVNQALSFGVPLVTAGISEDKAAVNARVSWSGVGIDLKTNEPTPSALREAIRAVLDEPNFRARASSLGKEFAAIDTRSEILRILTEVSHLPADRDAPVYAK
ncbi:MAG: nucleotide disphospho-sugar-binding domain-containing protein [Methylocella sp.]